MLAKETWAKFKSKVHKLIFPKVDSVILVSSNQADVCFFLLSGLFPVDILT